jgi:threonine dehydrogenase-like Zn-dependent dehydrogenase
LAVGEHVVDIVRRPDPVPCPNCVVGEWDMCPNGRYTERGIKQVHGFMAERWRIEPEYVVRVDKSLGVLGVLLKPTTGQGVGADPDHRAADVLGPAHGAGRRCGPRGCCGSARGASRRTPRGPCR